MWSGGYFPPREPQFPWEGQRVALGVCGGVSAYKVVQVARDLTLLGAVVDVVLTESARRFVTPLAFEGVTGRPPVTDPFSARGAALHVELARSAHCVCVAPATADFIARAAAGAASDLPTAVLLATQAPVLFAPAMNARMFAHPQTRINTAHLEDALGYRRIGPRAGELAVGEGSGRGRMAEPREIVEEIGRALGGRFFAGKRVLVTAGPTREPLDAVRYLGNRSSGRMGYALAAAAWCRGADVTLVTGPTELTPPHGAEVVRVETAVEMRDATLAQAAEADVAIFAAAVADYRPASPAAGKIAREEVGSATAVDLLENPHVAAEAVRVLKPECVSVGFALETSRVTERARGKMAAKGFDMIVANRADEDGAGFEALTNRVVVLTGDEPPVELPRDHKGVVAGAILELVREKIENR